MMNLYRLIAQLDDHRSPLCIVQDDAERQQTYQTMLRALDQRNPLAIRSHHPAAIEMTHGAVLRILTAAEAIAERGGMATCPISAGSFWLGRDDGPDDERPMRQHRSPAFWMMTHPVTVQLYDLAVQTGAVVPPEGAAGLTWDDQLRHPTHPVVFISLDDAETFATWLGRLTGQAWRVPTEAEWEYAARGTDQRRYP